MAVLTIVGAAFIGEEPKPAPPSHKRQRGPLMIRHLSPEDAKRGLNPLVRGLTPVAGRTHSGRGRTGRGARLGFPSSRPHPPPPPTRVGPLFVSSRQRRRIKPPDP